MTKFRKSQPANTTQYSKQINLSKGNTKKNNVINQCAKTFYPIGATLPENIEISKHFSRTSENLFASVKCRIPEKIYKKNNPWGSKTSSYTANVVYDGCRICRIKMFMVEIRTSQEPTVLCRIWGIGVYVRVAYARYYCTNFFVVMKQNAKRLSKIKHISKSANIIKTYIK